MLYVQDRLQLSESDVNKFHRHAVFCPEKECIEASLDSVQRHLKLSDTQLRNMALNFPEIITYIFDNNIRPKLNAVQKRLLLSDGEMQKVVLTLSKIFCYDFDGTSNPILKFLQDHLNLLNNELREIIQLKHATLGTAG